MMDNSYIRPPITEAVVEFRSSTVFNPAQLKNAKKAFKNTYEEAHEVNNFNVKVDPNKLHDPEVTEKIFDKFTSSDMTRQLQVTEKSLIFSELAPYSNWPEFSERISRDWETWQQKVGYIPIQQVGMRYINRIDVPPDAHGRYNHANYVSVYPNLPNIFQKTNGHLINVQIPLDELSSTLNLTSARSDSPLPNHAAVVLDIDIFRVFDSPPEKETMLRMLNEFRNKKNEIFESCITESARQLFNSVTKK